MSEQRVKDGWEMAIRMRQWEQERLRAIPTTAPAAQSDIRDFLRPAHELLDRRLLVGGH